MDSERQPPDTPATSTGSAPSQAARDATTVEIAFALISGGVLAGAVFLALASPALFWHGSSEWIQPAQWIGGTVFVGRVLWVLLRWRWQQQEWRQPSHPGRTSPDS
ncbi:hypothetical protein DVA86_04460 [Streptomyces armeniacus]|uniref:Uncharacterized protein n=1 Tax=Streptomyces armeniacus TaxID=83291 RepID=A0A345XK50_9ACTN|nr:DUF6332 family protein [Streptomyces armeniacus]AXK32016.1 hypothetical protein DVA86_04460 [Streptomyces armeniacus]